MTGHCAAADRRAKGLPPPGGGHGMGPGRA